jgi:hypothetical protein
MKRFAWMLVPLMALAGMAGAGKASAGGSEVTTQLSVPVAPSIFVPCANGGSGETVSLSGEIHVVAHVSTNSDGGLVVTDEFNPTGVTGVGQSTGTSYRGTGDTTSTFVTTSTGQQSLTYVNNFMLVSSGSSADLTVHQALHETIQPDETVTVSVDQTTVDCN